MPVLDFAIPTAFNTLDEVAFGDGIPVSAALGRELQENDRFLAAVLVKNVVCHAWDVAAPYVDQYHGWVTIYEALWDSTPTVRTVRLRGRAIITNGYVVTFGLRTDVSRSSHGALMNVTGTGAEQDFEFTERIDGGVPSRLAVYAICRLEPTEAFDVTGAVSQATANIILSAAAAFGGVAAGWAIRLEEGVAPNRPITNWHTVVRKVDNSTLIVRPNWSAYENASAFDSYGAAQFRARQISNLALLSLSVDEDPRTGQF